jgi:hypothetical protein
MPLIDKSKVKSVYSGKNGECCCGCSGTHSYASIHREAAGKNRGYAVRDEEVNDRQVARVVNKIEKLAAAGVHIDSFGDICVSAVEGKRRYIAYFR